ncbi:hypothetical protein BJ912DRAFT_848361, partial [Pholiota molesta]
MATVYDITVFKNHVKQCNAKATIHHPAANTRTLDALLVGAVITLRTDQKRENLAASSLTTLTWPCPGLTASNNPRIRQYLKRTSSLSAGGISEHKVAHRLFADDLLSLNDIQREAVQIEQLNTHRWRNDHERKRVFASGSFPCLKVATLPLDYESGDIVPPCVLCDALLNLRAFVSAINRPLPERKNRIYTPHLYQSRVLGERFARNQGLARLLEDSDSDGSEDGLELSKERPTIPKQKDLFCRFIRQFVAGHFDKKPVFLDLVAVMTDTAEREARGRGMQNKKYPPALDD